MSVPGLVWCGGPLPLMSVIPDSIFRLGPLGMGIGRGGTGLLVEQMNRRLEEGQVYIMFKGFNPVSSSAFGRFSNWQAKGFRGKPSLAHSAFPTKKKERKERKRLSKAFCIVG